MTEMSPAEAVFFAALAKIDPAERAAYLNEACGADTDLRRRVDRLLAAHPQVGSFLQDDAAVHPSPLGRVGPDVRGSATVDLPITERPGTMIGPYKLLQKIGEGGMGTVYLAEQTQPIQRKVALKIIKPGMDSRQVIARFEAERQALAMMDHINIARVFDAGATASGLPYFVMELVHGVPITKYCDDNHLTPRERLELFVPVCQAIQHAHQKGIIHRDVKPSNVMITLYDGKPIPKVIDFGVAKATEQKLTERTLFTQYGTMVGTLEYMSPEQAEMSALGVDTRSDIYSLGVLLYELLTGNTPLTHKRMKEAAYAEILRMIKEEEPPRPSTRLSDSGEALASISAQRHMEPAKLTKLVRGELDWIVMKTLEKDRNRRYETANGFAADVQRYLNDETVQACPPSAAYRFRKFARRNKRALTMTSVVALAMLLVVGSLGWMVRDRAAQEQELIRDRAARQAKVAGQVELILDEVERLAREQKWPEALAVAKRAQTAVTGGEADAATAQRVRELLKDLEFIDRLEQIRMETATMVEGKFNTPGADREYARAFRDYGVDVEELAVETSIDRLKARTALAIPLAAALDDWVSVRRQGSERDAAGWKRLVAVARGIDPEPLRDRLRSTWGQPVTPEAQADLRRLAESIDIRAQHTATLISLARTLQGFTHSDSALRILRDAQFVSPGDFWLNFELGLALNKQKDHERAIRFYTAAVSIRPNSAAAHNNLGIALHAQNKPDEAIACYRKAIELEPKYASAHYGLGAILCDVLRDYENAAACFRKAIELDPNHAKAHYGLGNVLNAQNKRPEAVAAYCKAIDLDPKRASAYFGLGNALLAHKKPDEAAAAYRKAIELDPKQAGYSNLGNALFEQKKWDEAIAAYRKAIDLDPKRASAYFGLGNALLAHKKPDEAAAAYRTAIEVDPKQPGIYNNLGNALSEQQNWDEAIVAYRKALEENPKNSWAHFRIGYALRNKGNVDGAIAAFRKAVELNPKSANAHVALGDALANKGWNLANHSDPKLRDFKLALEASKEALELAPNSTLAWQYLGWVHYRTGNWKPSIEALEKSCKLQAGGSGDSGQWIVLALAHAQLAAQDGLPEKEREHHKSQARHWYDQADKKIKWRVRPGYEVGQVIWDFRAEARELMGVKEKKD